MTATARQGSTRFLGSCGMRAAAAFAPADGMAIALACGQSASPDAIGEPVDRGAAARHGMVPVLLPDHTLVSPFALGLHRAIHPDPVRPVGRVMRGLAGLADVIVTLFPPRAPGCEPFVSPRRPLHNFVAIPPGLSILVALWRIGGAMRASPQWRRFAGNSGATAVAGAGLAAVAIVLAETERLGPNGRLRTRSRLQWYIATGLASARRRMTGQGKAV